MGRRVALLLTALLLAACSGTSAGRPVAPSPSPKAVLLPGDCTGSASSSNPTATKPLGMDSITLRIPVGWTDHTKEVTGVSALLYIQEPESYGADKATLMLVSVPGPRRGSS